MTAWLSRADEGQADLLALEVLGRPDQLTAVLRRLARRNRADVEPSRWKQGVGVAPVDGRPHGPGPGVGAGRVPGSG